MSDKDKILPGTRAQGRKIRGKTNQQKLHDASVNNLIEQILAKRAAGKSTADVKPITFNAGGSGNIENAEELVEKKKESALSEHLRKLKLQRKQREEDEDED